MDYNFSTGWFSVSAFSWLLCSLRAGDLADTFNKIVIIATHVVPDIEFIARDIIMLKKGVIVDNAPPHELTQKIEGKVWNVPCLESEVQSMQDKFRVTNIARDDESGDVLLRVLSEDMPTMTSKNVVPTLEDYYLYVFGDTVSTT